MMVVFSIVFLAIVCTIAYAFFLALWVSGMVVFGVKRKGFYGLMSLPAFALLLAGFFFYQTSPAVVFRDAFGIFPPATVTSLRSHFWHLGDFEIAYLRFKTDHATIMKIVALRNLGYPDRRGMDALPGESYPPPKWWTPPKKVLVYLKQDPRKDFVMENEALIVDPETDEVFYRYVGFE